MDAHCLSYVVGLCQTANEECSAEWNPVTKSRTFLGVGGSVKSATCLFKVRLQFGDLGTLGLIRALSTASKDRKVPQSVRQSTVQACWGKELSFENMLMFILLSFYHPNCHLPAQSLPLLLLCTLQLRTYRIYGKFNSSPVLNLGNPNHTATTLENVCRNMLRLESLLDRVDDGYNPGQCKSKGSRKRYQESTLESTWIHGKYGTHVEWAWDWLAMIGPTVFAPFVAEGRAHPLTPTGKTCFKKQHREKKRWRPTLRTHKYTRKKCACKWDHSAYPKTKTSNSNFAPEKLLLDVWPQPKVRRKHETRRKENNYIYNI